MTLDVKELFKETKLGIIPSDWNSQHLKGICQNVGIGLVTTMTTNYAEEGVFLIRNSDIKSFSIQKQKLIKLNIEFAKKHEQKAFKEGDIVTVHTGDIGTSAIIDQELDGAQGFATLNTRVIKEIIDSNYLCHLFNSVIFKKYVFSFATGDGRNNLNLKDFIKLLINFPVDIPEQKKIAKILTSVDNTIESTRKVIEQTKKVKQGLLQELLTKGIGHTKFKKTEIGEIPEEWEVMKLQEVASIIDCKHRTPHYSNEGYSVVRPRDIKEGDIDLSGCIKASIEEINDLNENHKPTINDILYSRNATFGIGAIVKTSELFAIGQDVCIITGNLLRGEFLFYLLNSPVVKSQLLKLSAGSTFKRINLKDIRNFKVPLISFGEQKKLTKLFSSLDRNLNSENDKLTQLQQLKKGLMQDLLTGKVRVKG